MALAMLSTAMDRKPSATSTGLRPISSARVSKATVTASVSNGSSPLSPNTLGKNSGRNLPSSTLQSVTASGPRLRYAAGPGSAPAESGPTLMRDPS